jgi:putative RNA 2'-phosphotransferase
VEEKDRCIFKSKKKNTAIGASNGKPIVFAVNTRAMYQAAYEFYSSDNNVWLADNVPP